MYSIGFIFGLVLIVTSLVIWWRNFSPAFKAFNADTRSYYSKDDSFMWWCILFIPAFIGFLFTVGNLGWLQIWLAPKVYLIEYAASLTK